MELVNAGRSAEAEPLAASTLQTLERLVADHPERPDGAFNLGYAHTIMAAILLDLGRLDEAHEAAEQGVRRLREARTAMGNHPAPTANLASALYERAEVEAAAGFEGCSPWTGPALGVHVTGLGQTCAHRGAAAKADKPRRAPRAAQGRSRCATAQLAGRHFRLRARADRGRLGARAPAARVRGAGEGARPALSSRRRAARHRPRLPQRAPRRQRREERVVERHL